jgi:hypothetical protein
MPLRIWGEWHGPGTGNVSTSERSSVYTWTWPVSVAAGIMGPAAGDLAGDKIRGFVDGIVPKDD